MSLYSHPQTVFVPSPPVDDVRLRYEGLESQIAYTKNEITGAIFPGVAALRSLVGHFLEMSTVVFSAFQVATEKIEDKDEQRRVRHQLVDKLTREWETIFQLVATAKFLGRELAEKKEFSWLDQVVLAAQKDLNIEQCFLALPRFSQKYSLTHFRYASEFAVLEIPITALNTPWEWSVLWHEMASRKIKMLKKTSAVENLGNPFDELILKLGIKQDNKNVSSLVDQLISNLQKGALIGSGPLNQIRKAFKDQKEKPNWSANWIEELFEDACSALTFGVDFIPILTNLTRRLPAMADQRHPDPEVRIRMAQRLINIVETEPIKKIPIQAVSPEQEEMEKKVADEILNMLKHENLQLPLLGGNDANPQIHQHLRDAMREFVALGSVTKDLRVELEKVERSQILGFSMYPSGDDDASSWPEIQSGDYRQILALNFSEIDYVNYSEHKASDHATFTGFASVSYPTQDGHGGSHVHIHRH